MGAEKPATGASEIVVTRDAIFECKEGLRKARLARRDAERRMDEFAEKLRAAAILLDYPENQFIDELDAESTIPAIVFLSEPKGNERP